MHITKIQLFFLIKDGKKLNQLKAAAMASGAVLLLTAAPLVSYALTFDVRGGYRSGSHAYETRLKVSNGWENGWWGSLETDSWNGVHNNSNEVIGLSYI